MSELNKKEGLIFKFLKKIFYKQKLENKVIYLEDKNSVEGRFQIEESYECDSNPKTSNVESDERNTFHRENVSSKKFITLKRIKLYREDVFILDHSWGNDYYNFLLESKTSFEAFILVKLSSSEVDILANKLALIKEHNKDCFEPSLNLEDIDSDKHPNIWKYNFLLDISKELNCLFFEYYDGRIEDNSPRLYVNVVDEYIDQGDYYCIDSNTLSLKSLSKELLNNNLSSDFPEVILSREDFEIIEVDRLYRKHGIYYEPFVYKYRHEEIRVLKVKDTVKTAIQLKQRAKNEEFVMKREALMKMDSDNSKGNEYKLYKPQKKWGSGEHDSSESYRYDIKKFSCVRQFC